MQNFALTKNRHRHGARNFKSRPRLSKFLVRENAPARRANPAFSPRYLDPKYSRWMSCDPAVSDYMSQTEKGEGGIYNLANLNVYHYGGNNPVRYNDPTGCDDFDPNGLLSPYTTNAQGQLVPKQEPPNFGEFMANATPEGMSEFLSGSSTTAAIFAVLCPEAAGAAGIFGLVTGLGSAGVEASQGNWGEAGKAAVNSVLSFWGGNKLGEFANSDFAGALAGLGLNFTTDGADSFAGALKDALENPQGETAGDFNKLLEKYGGGNFDFSKDFSKEDFKMDFMQLVKDYEANNQNQGEQ